MSAPAVVRAKVSHRRTRPFDYGFSHRSTMWLLDVDEPNAPFPRWLTPLARVRSRDHFSPSDDAPLAEKVRRFLTAQGLDWSGDRVLVLVSARSLGFVFNPLTTYFCFDGTGRLEGVLAEVHNTYGERHCYPLVAEDAGPPRRAGVGLAGVDKDFYVSPFFTVAGRYDIRVRLTEDQVAVAITLSQDGNPVFTGSVHGPLAPATAGRTVRALARDPAPSLRVSALIRWHGVRLWLRRLPVVPRRTHRPPKGMA